MRAATAPDNNTNGDPRIRLVDADLESELYEHPEVPPSGRDISDRIQLMFNLLAPLREGRAAQPSERTEEQNDLTQHRRDDDRDEYIGMYSWLIIPTPYL